MLEVTLTVMVQKFEAATTPPSRDTEVAPAVGAKVPAQLEVAAGVAATTTPDGRLSVRLALVIPTLDGFTSEIVNVDRPFGAIEEGENDLFKVGPCNTVNCAVAMAALLPALAVETAPTGMVLV